MRARTGLKKHEDRCGLPLEEPRFACPECPKKYQTPDGLKKHLVTHSEEQQPCPEPDCDSVFGSKDKLRNHRDAVHTDKFACTCGERLASMQNLHSHIQRKTAAGEDGHEPVTKKVVTVPEVIKKRKIEDLDPVSKFLDDMSDRLKKPDPANTLCRSKKKLCTTTRLKFGFPGGIKEYCSKHGDEVPGLVELQALCKYIGCVKKEQVTIHTAMGKLQFCYTHRKQLVQEGLPNPDINAKLPKSYHKKCIEEGCDKAATYDEGKYCGPHSLTGKSDDKRVCEVPGCDTRPSVGYPGETPRRCGRHKELGMVSWGSCEEPGCNTRASFGPPGGSRISCGHHRKDGYTNLVATTCAMACCVSSPDGLQAVFFHPEHEDKTSEFYQKRVCRFARRALIEDALMHNDIGRLESLVVHFKMDRVLTLNAQSAFRFACEKLYHPLLKDCVDIVFDGTVKDGPKVLGALRPDIFYKWCTDGVNYGIHIEYDETEAHEDDLARLNCIAKQADCLDRVYVIRVNGGDGTKNPACTRVRMEHFEYSKVTAEGERVASEVADAVKERIGWIKAGLGPCGTRAWKIGI